MVSASTCDWYEMKEKLWAALEEKLGYPGLAMFEQVAWKSHDSGRCHECGEPGEVQFERPMLAQAVPHYWLCWDCDEHYRVHVGGEKPRTRPARVTSSGSVSGAGRVVRSPRAAGRSGLLALPSPPGRHA